MMRVLSQKRRPSAGSFSIKLRELEYPAGSACILFQHSLSSSPNMQNIKQCTAGRGPRAQGLYIMRDRLNSRMETRLVGGVQQVVVEGVVLGDNEARAGVAVDGREVARAVGPRVGRCPDIGVAQGAGAALRAAARRVLIACAKMSVNIRCRQREQQGKLAASEHEQIRLRRLAACHSRQGSHVGGSSRHEMHEGSVRLRWPLTSLPRPDRPSELPPSPMVMWTMPHLSFTLHSSKQGLPSGERLLATGSAAA